MKRISIFLGLILSLLASAAPVFAQSMMGQSAEWQRLYLQKNLEEKSKDALKSLMDEKSFIVSVNIVLRPDGDVAANKAAGDRMPASTSALSAVASDLPLTKLGFWDGLVEEGEGSGRGPASVAGGRNIDVFKRIEKIEVNAIFDKSVSQEQTKLATEVLTKTIQTASPVVPVVNVKSEQLIHEKLPEPKPEKDFTDWILEFKTGLSLILATFLGVAVLAAMIMVVSRNFTGVLNRGIEVVEKIGTAKQENANSGSSHQEDSHQSSSSHETASVVTVASPGTTAAVPAADSVDGFAKFRTLLQESPDRAKHLVGKWLNSRTSKDAKALVVISYRATTQELNTLFGGLTFEEKKTCKRLLALPLGPESMIEGNDHIVQALTELYTVTKPDMPEHVFTLVVSLSENELIELATRDAELGAILFSILPSSKVSAAMNLLPTEVFTTLSERTTKIFDKDLASEAGRIEKSITDLRNRQTQKSLFMERAAELIPNASPDKEEVLYAMLLKGGDKDAVRDIAMRALPAKLIAQIPKDYMEKLLMRLSSGERAELIASQPHDRANFLLSCLGDPGKKLRDLVQTDVDEVRSSAARLSMLQEDAPVLWASFVSVVRQSQTRDALFARVLRPIVTEWINSMSANSGAGGPSSDGSDIGDMDQAA